MGIVAPLYDLDFRTPNFARDPYTIYEILRRNYPVCKLANGTHLLSRYEDVRSALKDHQQFASGWSDAPIIHPGWLSKECKRGIFLPEIDPPLHTTYKAIIKNSFTKKSIDELIPALMKSAQQLINSIKESGDLTTEILTTFSYPLASIAIEHITGLNVSEDLDRTRTWIELVESLTTECPEPIQKAEVEALIIKQNDYYDELIESRRKNPRNDLATVLAHATVDGKQLPNDQLHSALNLFTIGGFEAPAQLLAKSILMLSRRPDLKKLLISEPEKIRWFVEEMVRCHGSAQGSMRMTTDAIDLHGVTIPANTVVLALIGSANRDPHQFPNPNTVLLSRHNIKAHLGFGSGAHTCIGAILARIEVSIGLSTFLNSFDEFTCSDDSELDWYSTPVGRVLRALKVQLH